MKESTEAFKAKLEETHVFPTLYMFKFVVPTTNVDQVASLFPKNETQLKPSSGGKYTSVTCRMMVSSSEQIIETYESASKIEGVIAL